MSESNGELFTAGEVVHDRDDDDPNDAVVVNIPPIPASEWDVQALEKTLAEANPDYPDDAQTVVVVFQDALAEYLDTTDTTGELDAQLPLADLASEHAPFYAFPAPRLQSTGKRYAHASNAEAKTKVDDLNGGTESDRLAESASSTLSDPDSEADTDTENGTQIESEDVAGLDALEERLATSGMRVVDRDDEAGTLTIAKMRDTYLVEPGRVIEGDGRFRQRIEQLVAVDDSITDDTD